MTDSMQQMALDTLGAYFGYTSFRPGQDRMVDAILAGRDALGVMPTGAGKSICYQVPALMLPGITFVVSPLLSLMEDQTRALLAAGARPSYLNSSLTPAQQNTVLKRAREGRYQLMYVAPERLLEPRFLAFAQEAAGSAGIGVPLVAIDEAHCVSQWGQDFRPAYLQIREFIDSLPQRPIVAAFTATATERVRADIQQMLGLQNPATVVTGFDRKNLYFGCEEMGDKAKTAWVRDYVIAHSSESGIVYCSTRKTVDALAGELAEALGPSGIRVGRYHAGMGNDARRQSQRAFIDDDIQVMVATNAFGMGIDKPNVRYVIHNTVPESIEAYYQEAGRAGRDGDPASCHLLWNGNDFRMRRFLIDRGDAADEALDDEQRAWALQNRYRLLSQMEGYCNTTGCLREYMLRYFGDEAAAEHAAAGAVGAADDAEGCGNCSNCLTQFEVEDVTDIVLNVKGLVFRALGTTDEATATISVDGPCEVTGADFFIPSEFELVNPEQHIATLTEGGHLTMSMRIGYGRGYVSGEANKRDNDPIGVIHVDSLYSPVSRCAKLVEACRVGQHTDYDRLVLEIETNGSIAPRDAVVQAANIINQHMAAFMNLAETPEVEEEASIFAPEVTNDNAELDKQIEDLDLSVRSYNCLKRASIHSVRQLVEFSENDLLNIRNFGVKSIEEVKD